jgi:hypothetical protein
MIAARNRDRSVLHSAYWNRNCTMRRSAPESAFRAWGPPRRRVPLNPLRRSALQYLGTFTPSSETGT